MPPENDEGYGSFGNQGPNGGVTGWSVQGKLTTGDHYKKIPMQQAFPEADTYTCVFSIFPNADSSVPIICEAEVTWVVHGNRVKRRVTLSNGLSISSVAEAIEVTIMDNTQPSGAHAGSIPVNPVPYQVFGQVAKGSRATTAVPPMLIPLGGVTSPAGGEIGPGSFFLANLASASIPIPLDAGATAVLVSIGSLAQTAIPDQGIQVIQATQGGTIINRVYDPRDIAWQPLYPGCDEILITNNSGATAFVSIVLGVDG